MNSSTTTDGPASPRPDLKSGRALSEGSQSTALSSTRTLSPSDTETSTATSTSTSSSTKAPQHHHSFSFHFPRSRSKSPRPPTELSIPSTSAALKHAQTSPLPVSAHARHKSDGARPSPSSPSSPSSPPGPGDGTRTPRDGAGGSTGSWIQKKQHSSGPSPGGYGRHSNDWLFGGISITQTAKEVLSRRSRREGGEDR